jgi:hypothetical protein
MATILRSPIEELVDRLFGEYDAQGGDEIPVLGGVNWGGGSIRPLKKSAVAMLRAKEWFAVEGGPSDAPPLPLADEIENYRQAGGLKRVIGFYARSLEMQDFDYRKHPSFQDFARGLMALAMKDGVWGLEEDAGLIQRFPPLPLPEMIAAGCYWEPPKRQRRAA